MSDRVCVSIDDDGIADVRLNRPEKLNAWDVAMLESLDAVGSDLAARRSLRAVVLSGEGESFCAGLDLALFGKRADDPAQSSVRVSDLFSVDSDSPANFLQRGAWTWTEVPVLVIAAIHGVAYAGPGSNWRWPQTFALLPRMRGSA